MSKNNNIVENIKCLSQLDSGQVLQDAHDFPGHSLRTRDALSAIPQHYTHSKVDYNSFSLPTHIEYYVGTTIQTTTLGVVADVAGSLNNTYIQIYEPLTDKLFYLWFNVSSGGTDPTISGGTPIEIPINTNDPSVVIAAAIDLTINNLFSDYFTSIRKQSVIELITIKRGPANAVVDVGTGFVITEVLGEESKVGFIDIEYDSEGNPTFNGQKLIGHKYNVYTGKFELFSGSLTSGSSVGYSDVDYDVKSVGNTATLLAVGVANKEGRTNITIQPKGKTIWYGFDNTVTSGNSGKSFKLTSNSIASIDLEEGVELYAITSSGNANVAVSEAK